MIKYIIIPDVHGRLFYKDALDTFMENSDANMVFLGDYIVSTARFFLNSLAPGASGF